MNLPSRSEGVQCVNIRFLRRPIHLMPHVIFRPFMSDQNGIQAVRHLRKWFHDRIINSAAVRTTQLSKSLPKAKERHHASVSQYPTILKVGDVALLDNAEACSINFDARRALMTRFNQQPCSSRPSHHLFV